MRRDKRRLLLFLLVGLGLIGGIFLLDLWRQYGGAVLPPGLPAFPEVGPYTPWPTPVVAQAFDYPLLPADSYGPYVQGVTGPLAVDTRFGAQNPAQGDRGNCFVDAAGGGVPFSQLYHAGVDLFGLDGNGQVAWGQATNAPVHAVADGVVVYTVDGGPDGHVVIVEHLLPDRSFVYSVYWHVDHVQVEPGQPVAGGQIFAAVYNQHLNSHLHWEMRTFRDGSDLFPAGTAGGRGRCNGHFGGVGYTWDDDPARAQPDTYGYLDPVAFVEARR